MTPSRPTSTDRQTNETGSPTPGEPVFLVVGKLRRTHGVHGEIIMNVLTDFPQRLRPHKVVYVGPRHQAETIASVRAHGDALLIRFAGYDTCEQAGLLRNHFVYVKTEALPQLPEGEYYYHQLIGLRVMDEAGKDLGELAEILETGANDVYVVRGEQGEVLLPAIEGVILEVDLERRSMRVRPPEWM